MNGAVLTILMSFAISLTFLAQAETTVDYVVHGGSAILSIVLIQLAWGLKCN